MTTTIVQPGENTESPEAIAAALARVEKAHSPGNPQPAPTEPTSQGLLAGKYKSPEDLAKGYLEVQAYANRLKAELDAQKSGTPVEPKPAEGTKPVADPPKEPTQTPADLSIAKATDDLAAKGLSFDKFAESYAQNGKLTDEDYSELEKSGISRSLAETYVRGVEALRAQETAAAVTSVGGRETFDKMAAWAAQALSDADLAAYNEAVTKGGQHRDLALMGLKAKWQASLSTTEAGLISGSASSGGGTFSSVRELSQAQRDPRYGKDAAYTREVEQKAMRSTF